MISQFLACVCTLVVPVFCVANGQPTKSARTDYGRGLALLKQQEFEKAIDAFSQSIRIDKTYVDAYIGRGIAFSQTLDYENAIADYSEAIRLDPTNAKSFANRAAAYLGQKLLDRP